METLLRITKEELKENVFQRENETLQLEDHEVACMRALSFHVFHDIANQVDASFRCATIMREQIDEFRVRSECTALTEEHGDTGASTPRSTGVL